MSQSDLASLKLNRELATSQLDSYLIVSSGNGIQNLADSSDFLDEYDEDTAIQVVLNGYTRDSTRPEVSNNGFLNFDLDAGTFTIAFTEPVNATSPINTTSLSFQHFANSTLEKNIFQVEVVTCPDCDDGDTVTYTLPTEELNRLKLAPRICTSAANCWLTVESPGDFVTDMAGNTLVELPNGDRTFSRLLNAFVDDTTGPILLDFVLNLTSRELVLNFDEPVDPSTFEATGLTVVAYEGALVMEEAYQLTGGTLLSDNGTKVVLAMNDEDINGLQSRSNLATSTGNTWITVSTGTVADLSYQQNRAQELTAQSALVVPDIAPPEVTTFDIDFNSNILRLVFSEPVTVSSVELTNIILISSRSASPLVTYNITGGSIYPTLLPASAIVVFNLTESDIAFLKDDENIATNRSSIFLAALGGLAEDTSGTTSLAIPFSFAVTVRNLVPDVTYPEMLSFTLDMDNGEMNVVFSDVVNAATVDVSALIFQGRNNRVPLEWYSLSPTSSSASLVNSFAMKVFIGNDDLNSIKRIRTVATELSNTFLTVGAMLVDDLAGIDILAITDGKALECSQFTADSQNPVLESWTLDMDSSQIILSFSETVDILTLDVSEIALQPSQSASSAYFLTGYNQLAPDDAYHVLYIHMSDADSNAIKTDTSLGTNRNNSYLFLSSDTISDMNSNDIVAIDSNGALQAANYVTDESGPVLQFYDFDLNIGLLSLTFDETVNSSSFNMSGLTLTNRASRYTVAHTLTTSTHSTMDSNKITVTLSKFDLDSVTSLTSLAAGPGSTFLFATRHTVMDMTGNQLSESLSDLPVFDYT